MTDTAPLPVADYPIGIVTEPFGLDGFGFAPHGRGGQIERVTRAGDYAGDVLLDDNRFWFARKPDARGELSDWQPMRSVAEARAFIVSKIRP